MTFDDCKLGSRLTHPNFTGIIATVAEKTEHRITLLTPKRSVSFYRQEFDAQNFDLVEEKVIEPRKRFAR